jgi:hypothetical protein
MDGLLHATGRPDLTHGAPMPAEFARRFGISNKMSLDERVPVWERGVRSDLTMDHYTQFPPPQGDWRTLEGRELWRRIQILARPARDGSLASTEVEALDALTRYLGAWCGEPEQPVAGFCDELVLGLDLAIRHRASFAGWMNVLGPKLISERKLRYLLCLPAVAQALVGGLLRAVVGVPDGQLAEYLERIKANAGSGAPDAREQLATGASLKRTVSCDYNQFYLEHEQDRGSHDVPYFQDKREVEQGMSIFARRVGIGTPGETSDCSIEIAIEPSAPKTLDLAGAVQAVSFPFEVHGPLVLRSVTSVQQDEDPFELPNGKYDALVVFRLVKPKSKATRSGLREFTVRLTFFPKGAARAPQCIRLEEGQPSEQIFTR